MHTNVDSALHPRRWWQALGEMNILYPKIRLDLLPTMLGYGVLGGLLAGMYGIIHDQVTYSISHEYFTCFKFLQFHYANFGLPQRVFVAEIGFLATWWVGFFAAWFIARITVPAFPRTAAFRHTLHGCVIVFVVACAASIVGYLFGVWHRPDTSALQDCESAMQIVDLTNFMRAAYIHNASYLGGLIGLIIAIIYVRRLKNTESCAGGNAAPPHASPTAFVGKR